MDFQASLQRHSLEVDGSADHHGFSPLQPASFAGRLPGAPTEPAVGCAAGYGLSVRKRMATVFLFQQVQGV